VTSALFIQLQRYAYPGMYSVCGALKEAGVRYDVLVSNEVAAIVERIRSYRPDVVAIPCMTGPHRAVLRAAALVKRTSPDVKVLLGGIHPTLVPEIIEDDHVDFLCRGEGEEPVVELMRALATGATRFDDVQNLSWKAGDEIVHNPLRPLVEPLDLLPPADYSIYRDDRVLTTDTLITIPIARGCPFSCSYCHNSKKRELFAGLGHYVRTMSVDRVLDEVEAALIHYPRATAVDLAADTLGADLPYLSELFTRYSSRFDIPYVCRVRPEFINDDLARLLADTHCHMAAFGIESGSERVRKELLGRTYSNEHILDGARLLRKHGIRFRTLNVIGFPTETREEMLSTVDINVEAKPAFPWCSIFTPYPRTELTDYAIEHGYLAADFDFDDVPISFFSDTILRGVDRDFIRNLHALFQTLVLTPSLRGALEPLLSRPHGRVHRLLFSPMYSWILARSERRSVRNILQIGIANRKMFQTPGRLRATDTV
jgi:anaerobic magnesium-protoporphyrin IX monomethyl ester cyclase